MNLTDFVLPPLIALLLYLIAAYALLPLYRQRQRYAQYMPVSLPTSTLSSESWLGKIRDRIHELLSPWVHSGRSGGRRSSGLSDEEMDAVDDLEEVYEHEPADGVEAEQRSRPNDQIRLSRDLEAGFMDDSDEEDGEGRGRRR